MNTWLCVLVASGVPVHEVCPVEGIDRSDGVDRTCPLMRMTPPDTSVTVPSDGGNRTAVV